HDLPDLRQTRPQHRHHLTDPPTPNSERPKREMPRQCHLFSDHTSQFGTQRRIRDPRILCNRAFDVRQSGEQAFAQAFFVIHFFGRKTEYAGTPLTPTKPTAR
ncbi:hypothetical protein, partial [Bifidobacterium longum]|uniref:hypothetical protein n=1 Tax=Bifidobacterium longum TaxID=216816 RepID=UPI001E649A98